MKLCKSILAGLLALLLLAGLVLPVFAADEPRTIVHLRSPEDWDQLAQDCIRDVYSENITVSLEKDLDFTGREFQPIPSFSGIFEGGHHTVSGVTLTAEGSHLGLFRYLTADAAVKNLTVKATVCPEGSQRSIGGIAGSSAGLIRGCKFQGEVSGTEAVGGIAGTNEVSGIIEGCSVSGRIHGTHFAGGIAGESFGTVRSCRNEANINTLEEDNNIESVSFNPEFFMGKEAADTATDLGGIAGTTSGVIRDCENHGTVGYSKMGYNLGGIAGSQKGYVTDCRNYGHIYGRKECAGVSGQLEPVVQITYTEDTLQILRRQLDTTASLANRASANLKSGSKDMGRDIDTLHDDAGTALDALESLLPEHGKFPDRDTVIAAQNSLSSSLGSMQSTVEQLNQSAQSVVGNAAGDIRAITNQVAEISRTLDTAADHLGGEITDISDLDTPEDLGAKVESCENYGKIDGDLNVGGIVGAAAWENDLDPEDDYTVTGDRSLNVDSRLRAVILSCTNTARVSATKRNAGGIVGDLNLGLVKDCVSTGFVEAENADYVGGIAGTSLGYLRNNSAKCKLHGHSWLGGIAGSASIASDNRCTVMLEGEGEQIGSILGRAAEDRWDSESPIRENYYVPLSRHIGAIDGIDYQGIADSTDKETFLALDDLSPIFLSSTMTFRYPDGETRRVVVPMGDVVPENQIPPVPRKEDCLGTWEGLEDLDLSHMFFNVTLEPQYDPIHRVAQSDLQRADGKPILLAEGRFETTDTLALTPWEDLPEQALEGWKLPDLPDQENPVIHLCIPEDMDPRDARVLVLRQDGTWEKREATEDGCYQVFPMEMGDQAAAVYESHGRQLTAIWSLAGGAAVLLLLIALFLIHRKHKKKSR